LLAWSWASLYRSGCRIVGCSRPVRKHEAFLNSRSTTSAQLEIERLGWTLIWLNGTNGW